MKTISLPIWLYSATILICFSGGIIFTQLLISKTGFIRPHVPKYKSMLEINYFDNGEHRNTFIVCDSIPFNWARLHGYE